MDKIQTCEHDVDLEYSVIPRFTHVAKSNAFSLSLSLSLSLSRDQTALLELLGTIADSKRDYLREGTFVDSYHRTQNH